MHRDRYAWRTLIAIMILRVTKQKCSRYMHVRLRMQAFSIVDKVGENCTQKKKRDAIVTGACLARSQGYE